MSTKQVIERAGAQRNKGTNMNNNLTAIEIDDISNWASLECDSLCLAFPEMEPDRYEELRTSIAGLGLQCPIVLFEGKILDGKCRYRACMEEGIEPHFVEFGGTLESAYDYVVSANLMRQDFTPEERGATCEGLVQIMVERARRRRHD
jgi:hypothetical protein